MQDASLIITQAGHSTAMEILTLGKPALIIPDEGQLEQGKSRRLFHNVKNDEWFPESGRYDPGIIKQDTILLKYFKSNLFKPE